MADKLLLNGSETGAAVSLARGDYCWSVDGTFGGATVSLQMQSPDGTSWLTVADTGLTAEGSMVVSLPANKYRALVASGTPSALYASLARI